MRAADAARAAFAIGWAKATAQHPVPLTERARIACTAAMAVAEASPQPSNLPTLQLGQLEGIWAVIYARREELETRHAAALGDALDALSKLDWQDILDRVSRYLLLDPNMSGKELAGKLTRDITALVANGLGPAEQAAWRASMNSALVDATAEGQAVGLSLVGDAAGIVIDFNLAGNAAKDALAGNQVLWDQSAGWIAKQANGLGYQISQKLASLWAADAPKSDMLDAIQTILGSPRNNAALILDQAIGQALSVGAVDSYSLAGVEYVDYVTAGDRRVCPDCAYAEDNNSYALANVPQPPLHVSCRCCLAPSDYTPPAAALTLLGPYITADDGEEAIAA